MGAGAEVDELTLTIEGKGVALCGVLGDQFQLIRLVPFLHELFAFFGGEEEPLDGGFFLDDLLHFRFQGSQIFGGEGLLHVEIVVEAAVDGGADGQLGFGKEALHGLRQKVGGRVPEGLLSVEIVEGQDL